MAVRHNNLDSVQVLMGAKGDVNAHNALVETALLKAAARGHTSMVKALVVAKGNISIKDNQGFCRWIMQK